MIQFSEIFDLAVNLFDDPDIRRMYVDDPVGFQQSMRPYLIKGKDEFTHPISIADKLAAVSAPQGSLEEFDGDGSAVYDLSTQPIDGASFTFKVNGFPIKGGTYDPDTGKVTFPEPVPDGSTCSVAWYYAGAFTEDFSDLGMRGDYNVAGIMAKVKNILATSVAVAWALNEMNRALEIRNILSNADLSFYSPANSAQAKTQWHAAVQREMDSLEAQLNWRIYATPRGGSRFGK